MKRNGAEPEIESRVKRLIVEDLGITEEEVVGTARFEEDLGADSLDCVEMVIATEDEFKIEIPDEDAEGIKTVQNLIDYVTKRVG